MKMFIKTSYLSLILSVMLCGHTSLSTPARDEDGDLVERSFWNILLQRNPSLEEWGKHYYRKGNRYETKNIQKALQFYTFGSIYNNRNSLTRFQELTKKVN